MTSLANRTGLVLDKDFNMTTVPRLPNWTSNPKLALSTDSGTKRNVFWLGSDRRPHKLYITTQGWALQDTNVGVDEWPAADADSDLALAYERGTDNVRLYYVVGGLLHELRHDKARTGNGYEWKIAAALPVVAPPGTTTSTGGGGSTPNDSTNGGPTTGQETTDSQSGGDGGLSTGAKIGLGVGIALGVVAVGAACMSVWYVRRLKKTQAAARAQADEEEEEKRRRYEQVQQEQQQYNPYQYQQVQQHGGPHYPQSNGTSQFGSEMGSPETTYHYGGYIPDKKAPLASASPVPQEMNATPVVYELPEQRRATEMDGGSDVMSPQSTHR